MCEPLTIMAGVGMASSALSAYGSAKSAASNKLALRGQAQLNRINAEIGRSDARRTIEAGNQEQSKILLRGRQVKSAAAAKYAAGGIRLDSNSVVAAQTGTELITEIDRKNIELNTIRQAFGQRIDAGNMERGARSQDASAKSIKPGLVGVSTFLSSAGQVASSWYSATKDG